MQESLINLKSEKVHRMPILPSNQCEKIKALNRKFTPYAQKGWYCEGTDDANGNLYNLIFNNDTEEWFKATYSGIVVESEIHGTPIHEIMQMAKIQGDIRKTIA